MSETALRCSICRVKYEGKGNRYVCPQCGGSIEPEIVLRGRESSLIAILKNGSSPSEGIWGYRSFFPGFEEIEPVTMGEGNTPFQKAESLGDLYGISGLYLKNETVNPSASYKDRFASLAISLYRRDKVKAVAIGSAGNAGSSVAAYCAKAGIPCNVILPDTGLMARAMQVRAYGARFLKVDGEVSDCIELVEQGTDLHGWRNGCTTMLHNPLPSEGYKSIVYEMYRQMPETFPDVIICPVGGGILLSKIYKACKELKELGLIFEIPRIVGVQAEGCAPFVKAFTEGKTATAAWENAKTIASSINDPVTFEGKTALFSARMSRGTAVAVTDEEIRSAMREIARREAIIAEPSSAATVAAAGKLRAEGWIREGETVACILTGSGLRDLPYFTEEGNEQKIRKGHPEDIRL